jgi:hypothetical protein
MEHTHTSFHTATHPLLAKTWQRGREPQWGVSEGYIDTPSVGLPRCVWLADEEKISIRVYVFVCVSVVGHTVLSLAARGTVVTYVRMYIVDVEYSALHTA